MRRRFQTPMMAVIAFLCIPGCESRKVGNPETSVIGSHNVNAIRDADSASGYLIDGNIATTSATEVGANAGDYPVTKELGPFPSRQITGLLSILLDPAAYEWEYSKSCIATPGVKLSFRSGDHQIDLLLCFECDILMVYRDDKYVSSGNIDFGRPKLVALLKASYPDDPTIQSLANTH